MIATTQAEALPTRFSRATAEGRRVWRSEYIGPPPSPKGPMLVEEAPPLYVDPAPGEVREPQAFLVEQEAGATVDAHFHFVDQFQVVVAGSGHLGSHAVAPISVHFAGASTGYGPIRPGDQGLSYFTFRASADGTGAQYLPGARSRMRPGPRRNVVADRFERSSPEALARRTDNQTDTALESDDGLAIQLLRIAPHARLHTAAIAPSIGASMLVVNGGIEVAGKHCAAWSCLYAHVAEGAVALQAGAAGAEVLFLRYPHHNPAT